MATIQDKPILKPDNIPAILKDWDNWVSWAYEERDGKRTKIPKNPRTGGNAMSNKPETWAPFDEALAYVRDHKNDGVRGLGFELGDKLTPLVGIDLDHCRDKQAGKIEPWAEEIVYKLNSYTEITPSDEGLRIFVIAVLPTTGRKKGDFEWYDSGRFLTVTGNHLEGTPLTIESRWDEVDQIHREIFGEPRNEKAVDRLAQEIANVEDEDLITKARNAANGALFTKLYNQGDVSDYPSHSEADMALCGLLAFWTRNDAATMDRLFRQSKLYRDKWDVRHHSNGNTYGQETIRRAIEANRETYHPARSDRPRKKTASIKERRESPSTFQTFPHEALTGACGDFADAYAAISESPRHFYGMAYLGCLGSYLSGTVTLRTLLDVQPRLYMVLIGPSGRGRKSTALNVATGFFKDVFEDFHVMHQANSGEGLNVFLEKHARTILLYDEFLAFVNKATQKGNTILGAVTSLFEKNAYQTATKDKQLTIENAHLSMLAACTTDTWERCWEPDFTAIGLNNRLFLVPGRMEALVSLPPKLETEKWKSLRDNLRDVMRHAETVKEFSLEPDAYRLYDEWYRTKLNHSSLLSVRLDAYALRFMLLLAICNFKYSVDVDVVERAIKLADWQYRVRQELDPIDAENAMAKMEQTIRRVLRQGPKLRKELQQRCNANRIGIWIFNSALGNLTANEEVWFDKASKRYVLTGDDDR